MQTLTIRHHIKGILPRTVYDAHAYAVGAM